jgi:hypothetical protein
LEQKLRPNGAPIGYIDKGKGKPKKIDPEKEPLVRLAYYRCATMTCPTVSVREERIERIA